jgi:hypothetical protein
MLQECHPIQVMRLLDPEAGWLFRSLYGNIWNIGRVMRDDVKLHIQQIKDFRAFHG